MFHTILGAERARRDRPAAGRHIAAPELVAVFAVAFLVRLLPVLRGGGLHFYGRYDDGVYYTASESLTFGHVPYRDFVLLHPPGSLLALMPFALLGRLTSDPVGMTVARLSFMALGSASAVLVGAIAGRWGRMRGFLAGLLYATSAAAVYSEQTTFLEPVGTALVLLALLALSMRNPQRSLSLELLAGVALGLACSVKIWYAAVLAAIVLVLLIRREPRAAGRVAAAGVVATTAVLLPFFALAPHRMWTMVVADQLDRAGATKMRIERVTSILGTRSVFEGRPAVVGLATVIVLLLIVVAVIRCLRDRSAWIVVGWFLAAALVLGASPSYFRHYGVFLAAPMALVLAIGWGDLAGRVGRVRLRVGLAVGAAAALLAAGCVVALQPTGKVFPAASFSAAAPAGCLSADDPAALIWMDRLTTDLHRGCDVPVDITGASYGAGVSRGANPVFRTWLMDHLIRSAAFVVLRLRRDRLSPAERQRLSTYPILASGDGVNLRAGGGTS
ncbi:glycosyltransferase 87 family protein [Nocardioides sp. BP30]|uniref:glycosyltransferase 87 family protein n=1 Tax=Nocardioides sp. BP30 TaxID=3036374 RepID=UPI002468519E|nr:glycosyltransferase 87 family protein [Nocardioides sp. BP30]WGL52421.1 glycosyltransferase 87 family protein [Nocardioides sp. BP30]